jgi:predicted transcriptional regulator
MLMARDLSMLNPIERDNLLKGREKILADAEVQREAEDWDLSERRISAAKISTVYSFMKTKYQEGHTLVDMERILGFDMEGISYCLKALEEHGYVAIARASKPYRYAVIK